MVILRFTILTINAIETLGRIHERMPVVPELEGWPLWLGESASGDPAGLLRPSAAKFRTWHVSAGVNKLRTNAPTSLESA